MDWIKRVREQLDRKLPFAAYRKPGEQNICLLFQSDARLHRVRDLTEQGFVMAPFIPGEDPTVLIRPDERLEVPYLNKGTTLSFEAFTDPDENDGKQNYLRMAIKAIEELNSDSLQKVVLSRRKSYPLHPDPMAVYGVLLSQFPGAFAYWFYHPEIGMWMGASPETLLRFSGEQFVTVSLAGTQKVDKETDPKWGEKEIREQEYVTQYIKGALENCGGQLQVAGPETVKAGNLYHLKSAITCHGNTATLGQLIAQLHPTPAVCGIPLETSRNFLLAHEGYHRAYYTGYLGELNLGAKNSSELYVNLRCMQIEKDQVHVYVGGGLVKGSDPEKEWQETVHKSISMGHLIVNSTYKLG